MMRPTLDQLKAANPIFFDEGWMEIYGEAKYEIIPDPDGGWFLIVEAKYSRPRYKIIHDLTLEFDGHEE